MRRFLPAVALVLAGLLCFAAAAHANPRRTARALRSARIERQTEERRARWMRRSRSVGWPWQGALQNGVRLEPSPYVRWVGEYARAGHFYGTGELVALLERAALRVAVRLPGARLSVGELSRAHGGEIDGHGSHESGRDADIAFYMLDGRARPFDPWAFAAFDGNGEARAPNEGLRFDDARNWELVARLVTDPDARVQFIFVSNPIRGRLLAEARRRRAPRHVVDRAAMVLVQPAHGHPHRNHFHVRIYCPPADRPACRDRSPYWPWYPGPAPREADENIVAPGSSLP